MAEVQVSTSINDVYLRGARQLPGTITLTVTGDDFSAASPQTPIFIAVTLDKNAKIAKTLVDLTSADPTVNQPVYLTLGQFEFSPDYTNNAPTDAVSIVRWKAGEARLWIRVQRSSSEWLLDAASNPTHPTPSVRVSWTVGVSARTSFEATEDWYPNFVNLPFNTRNLQTTGEVEDAHSTLICTDLSASTLGTTGLESILNIAISAYDETAEISPGVYGGGNLLPIDFVNDTRIARGKETDCAVSVSHGPSRNGVVQQQLDFILNCSRTSPFFTVDLTSGSFLTLETDPSKEEGFRPDNTWFLGDNPGVAVVDPDSAFTSNGKTYYSRIHLYWDGPRQITTNYPVSVVTELVHEDPETAPEITWSWNLVNNGDPRDSAPFDGPHQHNRCEPDVLAQNSGALQFILAIPTLTTWGLMAFLTLFLAAAVWFMRKNRSMGLGSVD